MKKTFLLLTIAYLAASIDLSAHETDGPVETAAVETYEQHYDFRDFTALSVANAFHVDFAFADDWSVDISVPDFIEPYLKVNCSGDKVRIGLNKLPVDIQRKLSKTSDALHATVRMPKLLSLSLSGAVHMTAEGSQELEGEPMSIEMSGASKLESLVTSGDGILHLELSGASKAGLQADFKQMKIGVSSRASMKILSERGKIKGSPRKQFIEGRTSLSEAAEYHTALSAFSTSSMMSRTSSIPTDRRIRSGPTPQATSSSSVSWRCVALAG